MILPLVSVIIPLYNSEHYILDTIDSVLCQSYNNIEIIVVDDGSTDKSVDLIKNYNSPKIQIFKQKNKGASAARNSGLRVAKGDYIQFLDADDLLDRNKIEKQVNVLLFKNDNIAVCSGVHFYDGNDHIKDNIPQCNEDFLKISNPVDFLLNLYGVNGSGNMVTVHSWLTPMKIIKKIGWWNEDLSVDDDGEFFCRVLLGSRGVAFVSDVNTYYRKYKKQKSLSSRLDIKGATSLFRAFQLKCYHLEMNNVNDLLIRKVKGHVCAELSVIFYPKHKELGIIAEKIALENDGSYMKFYMESKSQRILTRLMGWKFTAYFSYFKSIFRINILRN